MSDTFTETTTKSWTTRIGESIKGVLFGLVLIVGSGVFLFWNEGRAVQTQRSLTEGAEPGRDRRAGAASMPPTKASSCIVSGDIKPGAPLTDPDFTVSATALRLVRTVEMYQWKEESRERKRAATSGGGEETVTTYEYVRDLARQPLRFQPVQAARRPRQSADALPQRVLRVARRHARRVPPGRQRDRAAAGQRRRAARSRARRQPCRAASKGPVHVADGRIYLGDNPSTPRIGDLRVSFKLTPGGPASIIARQAGTGFAEYQTKAGDRLLMVRPGTQSAAEMFSAAQRENRILTWLLRLGGVLAMFFGFFLILNPLVVVADVVPFLGGILARRRRHRVADADRDRRAGRHCDRMAVVSAAGLGRRAGGRIRQSPISSSAGRRRRPRAERTAGAGVTSTQGRRKR